MLELNTKTFTEGGIAHEANYSEQYQLTKLASDMYQLYSFADRNAELCNTKEALKRLASLRGGRSLDKALSNHVINMDTFSTITVTASATALTKTASAEDQSEEPWKVVAMNGVEYFVSTKEEEEQEPAKKVTAAANTKHVYTVQIQAHNVSEIAKIAGFAEEKLQAIPATTQVPTQNSIVFDVATEGTPEDAKASIQKEVEGGGIFLQDKAYNVFNDGCPCGCGKVVQSPLTQEQVKPVTVPAGKYVLITVESPKCAIASSVETLKKYADAHYETYKIADSNGSDVFVKEADNTTFGDALTALSKVADEVLSKIADNYKCVQDQNGKNVLLNEETKEAYPIHETGKEEHDTELTVTAEDEKREPIASDGYVAIYKINYGINDEVETSLTDEPLEIHYEVSDEDDEEVKAYFEYNGNKYYLENFIRWNYPEASLSKNNGLINKQSDYHKVAEDEKEQAYDEKDSADTNAKGDDNVKKWKGLREDQSGKFVVYITETEEHIFDNLESAVTFLTKK